MLKKVACPCWPSPPPMDFRNLSPRLPRNVFWNQTVEVLVGAKGADPGSHPLSQMPAGVPFLHPLPVALQQHPVLSCQGHSPQGPMGTSSWL